MIEIKKIDFTNPAQWRYEAFCVFGPLENDEGRTEAYYIAEMISEMIAEENERANTYNELNSIEWFDYDTAHDYADENSRFKIRSTCDHCGAHFRYGAAYRNIVTNEHAIVGHVCATNTLNLTASEYAIKRAKTRMKAIRERARADVRESLLNCHRRRVLNYGKGFDAYNRNDERRAFAADLANDMRHKFRKYESLSVKQWAFVRKVVAEDIERAERRAAERANAAPIPDALLEGRHTFTGRIVSTRLQDSMYGSTMKMLFVDDRGFKLWGSVPSSLPYDVNDRVQFDAAVERSDDDETFGFFNRPTKARNLEPEAA